MSNVDASDRTDRPLDGLRVLDLAQLQAGPLAATYLAYFGADVIKVEPPGPGDVVRGLRSHDGDTSLWWRSLGRNKRSVTVDLRNPAGQDLVRRLARDSDVLIESFRPGTMERWQLGPEPLRAENPGLVYARVSGFGQTGPYASRRGFASICEAVAGLRFVTGHPGQPPVRPNLSLGDSLAGFQTVIGVLLALQQRARDSEGRGQVIDVALTEAVLGVMETAVTEYAALGIVREPSGSTVSGVVPTDAYPCADGRSVVIGANAEPLYRRLMRAAGRADLAEDPRLADNAGRVAHRAEVDGAIAAWTRTLPSAEVLSCLEEAGVPAGPIQTVAEVLTDPHFRARGLFEEVAAGDRQLLLPALGPRLADTPGRTTWAGPELGAHTDEVLEERLGLDREEIRRLRAEGAI